MSKTKAEIEDRLKVLEARSIELMALMAPIYKQLEPLSKERGKIDNETRELFIALDELAFEPSLKYILSVTHDKFHLIDKDHNCSFHRMRRFVDDNYKHILINTFNVKTGIHAVTLNLLTGHSVDDILTEIEPVIRLALVAKQESFHLFTDDLSYNGTISLHISDGKYEISKSSRFTGRDGVTFNGLREAIEYCIRNKMTYTVDNE